MSDRLTIWYHGTDGVAANKIREEGFQAGTYFGEHLEDAFFCGGAHIFEVAFPADMTSEAGWQVRVMEHVPVTQIIAHYVLDQTYLYQDATLRNKVYDSNRDESAASRDRSREGGGA